MLARRDPITLRSLVQGTGVSTIAVYTYFGGMSGLWSAVRQESFIRLRRRLRRIGATADPVRDLACLGAAYVTYALDHPDLYRTMFDDAFALEDPAGAAATFDTLVGAVRRAVRGGRFADTTNEHALATEYWVIGHGTASLAIAGVLSHADITDRSRSLATALFIRAGDDPSRCERSFDRGWNLGRRPASARSGGRTHTSAKAVP